MKRNTQGSYSVWGDVTAPVPLLHITTGSQLQVGKLCYIPRAAFNTSLERKCNTASFVIQETTSPHQEPTRSWQHMSPSKTCLLFATSVQRIMGYVHHSQYCSWDYNITWPSDDQEWHAVISHFLKGSEDPYSVTQTDINCSNNMQSPFLHTLDRMHTAFSLNHEAGSHFESYTSLYWNSFILRIRPYEDKRWVTLMFHSTLSRTHYRKTMKTTSLAYVNKTNKKN